MHDHYPTGTVRALLATDQVTEATRQVLTGRLLASSTQPQFFSVGELALLRAVCDRLIPREGSEEPIDVVGRIDKRIAKGTSDGWRYDAMPPDGDAYKMGLSGIDETARLLFSESFQRLPADKQDDILGRIQRGEAPGEVWEKILPIRFFEELLTEAAHNYYSHPLAQEEIGYVGMADVPTWQRIGLNQLEDREPRLVNRDELIV